MSKFENLTVEQRIRASLFRDLQSLSKETCHFIGLDITKPAMEMLFEIFMHKLTCYAEDLEAFVRRGGRYIIHRDDVRLLARRNKALTTRLDRVAPDSPINKEAAKRRKTAPAQPNSPAKRPKPTDTDDEAEKAEESDYFTDA